MKTAAEPKCFRTNAVYGDHQGVDPDGGMFKAGLIKGVSIATLGEAGGHDLWLGRRFLNDAAELINAAPKGIKSRLGHPAPFGEDAITKQLGKITNARVVGDKVIADLHFTKASHKTPGSDLAAYVMDMAESTPDSFGASVAFMPGEFLDPSDPHNMNDLPEVTMHKLLAVDLVDDPAANVGLYTRKIVVDNEKTPSYPSAKASAEVMARLRGVFKQSHPKERETKMQTSSELRAEMAHKIKCGEDLLAKIDNRENSVPTEQELADLETFERDADQLRLQAERMEAAEAKRSRFMQIQQSAMVKSERQSIPVQPASSTPNDVQIIWEPWEREIVAGSLRAFSGPNARRDAYVSGRWLFATLFKHPASIEWCKRNPIYFAQGESTNSAGGALTPAPLSQAIINLREQYGVFRQNAEIVPMGSDQLLVPRAVGGLTATFTSENTALTESDQVFDNITLTTKKLAVITRMSTEVSEDSIISLADFLARQMAEAIAYKEDLVGFTGNATAAHGNITGLSKMFTDNPTYVGNVSAAAGHDNIGELTIADFHAVMGVLPAYALRNAKWYCSSVLYNADILRIAAAAGGNTIGTLSQGGTLAFLGYPIVISQVLPSSLTTDYSDVMILFFGDLRLAAMLGDRRGITVATSSDRYFEIDQIAVRCTERLDINVHDVGNATTAGPIVGLSGVT